MKKFSWISNKYIISFLSLAIIIVVWHFFSAIIDKEIILPSPYKTLTKIIEVTRKNNFTNVLQSTITRTIFSFIFALFIGGFLGILGGIYPKFQSVFEPIITILRTVPTMAIILLALIWLGGEKAPILISFLVIFPIIYMNILKGITSVDIRLIEMAKVYNVKKYLILKEIYFTSIVPFLIAAINSAMGLGFKVTVAAEVLGDTKYSIGKELQLSSINLDTSGVFAWAIILILIVVFFDIITNIITKIIKY